MSPGAEDAEYKSFEMLVSRANEYLNRDASANQDFYLKQNGTKLEECVFEAYLACSRGTEFEGSVKRVGGQRFPDIVVKDVYGVEVKSTKEDSWKSTGSSILESSRVGSVKYVFMVFGKLCRPVKFISRPYEECLSDIAVTHYPRYRIDMSLSAGETIFDKMGISYHEISSMDNPVAPIRTYYRSLLKDGEQLWWDGTDDAHDGSSGLKALPPVIRMWNSKSLPDDEKRLLIAEGFARFPEILSSRNDKYDGFSLWLFRDNGVICNNVRDIFSAGGTVTITIDGRMFEKLPRVILKLADCYRDVLDKIDEIGYKSKYNKSGLDGWIADVYDLVSKRSVFDAIQCMMYCSGDIIIYV